LLDKSYRRENENNFSARFGQLVLVYLSRVGILTGDNFCIKINYAACTTIWRDNEDTARNRKKFPRKVNITIQIHRIEHIFFSFIILLTSFLKGTCYSLAESLLTSTNAKLSTGEFSQAWQEIFLSNYQFLLLRQGDDLLLYTWDTPRYENR